MSTIELRRAAKLQSLVISDDLELLHNAGAAPFTPEAVPHYTAWTRQDMVLVVSLLTSIANYAKYILLLLALIAALLAFRGFR